jgi:hypothetical protein
VRVDRQGNIWIVDAPGHVIYKMNAEGKLMLRLWTKGTSGSGPNTFNLPFIASGAKESVQDRVECAFIVT